MSAFIVSKRHIDVLVEGAIASGWQGLTKDALGRMLWAENLKSLQARYPADGNGNRPGPNGFRDEEVTTYRFEPLSARLSIVEILKAIHCYEYQSCEHADWPSSVAAAFCNALQNLLIRQLPGYEEAPWSWG